MTKLTDTQHEALQDFTAQAHSGFVGGVVKEETLEKVNEVLKLMTQEQWDTMFDGYWGQGDKSDFRKSAHSAIRLFSGHFDNAVQEKVRSFQSQAKTSELGITGR
jgi:hypothetical protein